MPSATRQAMRRNALPCATTSHSGAALRRVRRSNSIATPSASHLPQAASANAVDRLAGGSGGANHDERRRSNQSERARVGGCRGAVVGVSRRSPAHAPSGNAREALRRPLARLAVHGLSQQIGMSCVPRILLDQVDKESSQRRGVPVRPRHRGWLVKPTIGHGTFDSRSRS